jgi:small conductance mechanosensitive channel
MPALPAFDSDLMLALTVLWGTRILFAAAILLIGRWIAAAVSRAVRRLLERTRVDNMLARFAGNLSYVVLLGLVILAALDQLGINTTSALAVLGALGLAVGLALKDSLSNFAAGIMLMFFHPFRVGHFIEAGGTAGTVEEVQMFHTLLRTPDNRMITVPNGQIYAGTIVNYSQEPTRRIDLMIGVSYDDDLQRAREVIRSVLETEARILTDPAPTIMIMNLGDSSVDIAVRPWVRTADFWSVRGELIENLKVALENAGLSIPYPQRDVYLHTVQTPGEAPSQTRAA